MVDTEKEALEDISDHGGRILVPVGWIFEALYTWLKRILGDRRG